MLYTIFAKLLFKFNKVNTSFNYRKVARAQYAKLKYKSHVYTSHTPAPSEDRTHDLKIMRLTRYLLRYRGDV